MSQNSTVTEQLVCANWTLEDVMEYIDELHSAASEGESQAFTGMTDSEVINTLRDLIFTAQEAVNELEAARSRKRKQSKKQGTLYIVPKFDKAG